MSSFPKFAIKMFLIQKLQFQLLTYLCSAFYIQKSELFTNFQRAFMTEDQLVKSLEDVSVAEAFKNAKGSKLNEFRIFWIHKSRNAEESHMQFQRTMSGDHEISLVKISELQEHYLKLCQYHYVLSKKSQLVVTEDAEVLSAVNSRLDQAEQWKYSAGECLDTLRDWTFEAGLSLFSRSEQ
ncbi:hypothetical protein SAMN05216222_5555 [Pseudomonas prosekii]|uniref:Uncharacterized protein n=2 Tax=Pseudomonas prosekii TaxID=1148509 RepID=A0A1H2BVW7_9PSED|nr:hypothetical protein SAMN05216222_5546 [Pseudomonas prosekii]SDT62552.1 hypothetical protein SAMN05216222_5555 [Pseudomonas prosekii]